MQILIYFLVWHQSILMPRILNLQQHRRGIWMSL